MNRSSLLHRVMRLPVASTGLRGDLPMRPKIVDVRQYMRFRLGKLEVVCKHRRSLPIR